MKTTHKLIGGLVLAWLWMTTWGSGLAQTAMNATDIHSLPKMSDAQLNSFLDALDALPQLSAAAVPKAGTFLSLQHPEWPALPGDSHGASVWQMNGFYLLNDVGIDYNAPVGAQGAMQAMGLSGSLCPGGGGRVTNTYPPPPDVSNYLKYQAQTFAVIDTNAAAVNDTNLYNACAAFADTNTNPTLQISQYQPGCLLLKASHFDYSAETRDFCLVVCDKVETPLFKSIDLLNPANNIQNGGWLVQGSVPAGQRVDSRINVTGGGGRS